MPIPEVIPLSDGTYLIKSTHNSVNETVTLEPVDDAVGEAVTLYAVTVDISDGAAADVDTVGIEWYVYIKDATSITPASEDADIILPFPSWDEATTANDGIFTYAFPEGLKLATGLSYFITTNTSSAVWDSNIDTTVPGSRDIIVSLVAKKV